jgi:hypothetical protein
VASRRNKYSITIDDRTDELSDRALYCRTFGHKWELKAQSRKRFNQMWAEGLVEYSRYCEHGCGSTWRQVWDVRSKQIVENDRRYPSRGEYLLPSGSGRLARGEAWAAHFARSNPGLV